LNGPNFTRPSPLILPATRDSAAPYLKRFAVFTERIDFGFTFVSDEFDGVTKSHDGNVDPTCRAVFRVYRRLKKKMVKAAFISAFTGASIKLKVLRKAGELPATFSITRFYR
jgi:hypothetical protein